jgi:teichuronic acid biosynthesis glycosyltransferase TuaG
MEPVIPGAQGRYTDNLVSVITPTFNSSRFVEQTIQSVLAQSLPNWELILVDDHSQDATAGTLHTYAARDSRIRVEILPSNQGAAAARNRGIELARGRYLAFLDSDDLWEPAKLERQLAFMRRERCGFAFTGYRLIAESGAPLGQVDRVPARMTYEDYLRDTMIGCLTVMLDRQVVGEVRFPALRTRQDTALWLQLLRTHGPAHGLPEELARYRVVQHSITRNNWKAARQVWRVYREIEQLSLPKASWCFVNYSWNALRRNLNW